jgi:hypothetical protein
MRRSDKLPRAFRVAAWVLTVAWIAGCSEPPPPPGPDDAVADDAVADDAGANDAPGETSSPTIVAFTTNVGAITDGESVTFTAVVTDPDGIRDVIGGTLLSDDGAATYGAFPDSHQGGTFTLTLTWAEIQRVRSIQFVDREARVFRARFFDQAAHRAEATVALMFHCDGLAACAGHCTDLARDVGHCGSCERACTGDANSCSAGSCHGSVCVSRFFGVPATCAAACTARRMTCMSCGATDPTLVGRGMNSNSCTPYFPGPPSAPDVHGCDAALAPLITADTMSIRCCCGTN